MSDRRRTPAVVVATFALVGAALTGIATGPASARGRDRDCSDFPSQAAAQHFFASHGGSWTNDFDNLDGDRDGIACESLPCPCSRASGGDSSGGGSHPSVPGGRRLPARIVRDVDGDSVAALFANGAEDEVRLIGIDTPEDVKPDYPVECGSRTAARSMRTMAAGRAALLVTDPTQARFDRYGRLLGRRCGRREAPDPTRLGDDIRLRRQPLSPLRDLLERADQGEVRRSRRVGPLRRRLPLGLLAA